MDGFGKNHYFIFSIAARLIFKIFFDGNMSFNKINHSEKIKNRKKIKTIF